MSWWGAFRLSLSIDFLFFSFLFSLFASILAHVVEKSKVIFKSFVLMRSLLLISFLFPFFFFSFHHFFPTCVLCPLMRLMRLNFSRWDRPLQDDGGTVRDFGSSLWLVDRGEWRANHLRKNGDVISLISRHYPLHMYTFFYFLSTTSNASK